MPLKQLPQHPLEECEFLQVRQSRPGLPGESSVDEED